MEKSAQQIAFEEWGAPSLADRTETTEEMIDSLKQAAGYEDPEAYAVAYKLASIEDALGSEPHNGFGPSSERVHQIYENLGGKYKAAFGAPMFNMNQLSGSPALSGGMSQRASTPSPTAAPQQPQQAPKAPGTTRNQGQQNQGTSAPSAAPAASAPSATSVTIS